MGHWGTAILSNDNSSDIKDTFFDLFDKGHSPIEIRQKLEKEFKECDDLNENTDLWLTLSLLQWQIGALDSDVKKFAEKIIDEDIDIKVWKDNDADEKTIIKRKIELLKLKEKLQTDNPKPRKIKKKIIPKSILSKGSVYAFPLKNGQYSALIVLEEILNPDYYFVLLAITDICKTQIPNLEDVSKSSLLTKPIYNNDRIIQPTIASFTNSKHKDTIKTFQKIGEVLVKHNYQKNYLSFGAAPWSFLLDWSNMYLVDNYPRPNKNFLVSDYIITNSDKTLKKSNWLTKLLGR